MISPVIGAYTVPLRDGLVVRLRLASHDFALVKHLHTRRVVHLETTQAHVSINPMSSVTIHGWCENT